MTWPSVRIGEVLRLDLDKVAVDPSVTYPMVGVLSFGRGLFEREPVHGGGTSYRHFYRLKAHHIVMSQLFGWEGAIALSEPRFEGAFLSPQFPTFSCDKRRLRREFFGWFIRRRRLWESLGARAVGMGDRRRTLNPEALLGLEMPLPSVSEQQRITERIEHCQSRLVRARDLRLGASRQLAAAVDAAQSEAFPVKPGGTLADYISVQSGYAFKSEWFSDEGIRLVRNVNIGHGSIDWDKTVQIPEARSSEFRRFALEEGDILVSLDRPLISTGAKVAKVRGCDVPSLLLQRVGRICFSNTGVDRDFFFAWLRSPRFREAIDPGRSNGVPHISPKDIERIPFCPPPVREQRRIVAYLDAFQTKVDALNTLQEETAAELDALLPSILDKAFMGEL